MKTWLRILFSIAGVGLIAAILIYKLVILKPHMDVEKATADYMIPAKELYDHFKTDKKTADSLYTGKVIEITGALSKSEENDSLVIAVMSFEQGDFGDEGVRCTMLPKYDAKLKSTTAGTDLKIKGMCQGYNDTDVILEKCSIVD